jgi:Immunoglobulin I-set domain
MRRIAFSCSTAVVLLAFSFAGCGGYSGTASVNGNGPVAPYITTQPVNQTVTAGQTATFMVAAAGSPAPTVQWQVSTDSGVTFNNLSGATSTTLSFTTAISQNGNKYRAMFTNTAGSVNSSAATLTVNASSGGGSTDVLTHHYDVSRSGVNSTEALLTTSNVNSTTFGKVGEFAVDGQIDGQALFLSQLAIPGLGNKDILYVATENDTVYAVDAQSIGGSSATILWQTRVLPNGETPATSLPCGNISPNGITATPVIDRTRNAIYVEAMSQDSARNIIHRLHALDLTTGKELFGGPTTITATYPGTGGHSSGGVVTFDPSVQHDRAALLESGGIIYTAWSGLWGDCGPYSAWVIAFDAATLKQTGAIDLVPNNSGAGMWMGGGGPAADAAGNVYVISGNGFGDTPGTNSSYGNSFVRLSTSAGLKVGDYFTPYNTLSEDSRDADFGSAGPLLLPDLVDASNTTRHLAVGAGKDGNLYVLNRDNMGQFNSTNNNVYQQFQLSSNENHSSPVFFNNTVYICPENSTLKAFPVSRALLATSPSTQSAHVFGSNGAVASVSANGTAQGIVWALDWGAGILFAYDASDLTKELYASDQAASNRDHFSAVGGHFIAPMVANGRVYVGTKTTVAVFGLLP